MIRNLYKMLNSIVTALIMNKMIIIFIFYIFK